MLSAIGAIDPAVLTIRDPLRPRLLSTSSSAAKGQVCEPSGALRNANTTPGTRHGTRPFATSAYSSRPSTVTQ